ncbi:peptide synthetase [Microbacterium sp. P03]|uniref:peptide synthetase n=1 Tax=Microbacterium sp. P03 TaxID=3366946 RepID=UPI003746E11F
MRLTNVALISLPPGRVMSYGFDEAGADAASVPVSFDQGRHVGEGDRPGSWMAIAFRVPEAAATPRGPVTDPSARLRAELATAWDAVVARHGTLRTAFSPGGGDEAGAGGDAVRLHEIPLGPGRWQEHSAADDGEEARRIVRRVFDAHCRPFARPSHRLIVVEPPPGAENGGNAESAIDPRPVVLIGSDHSHVDMWSLQVLVRDLVTCLDDVRGGRDPGAALEPATPFAVHTAQLAAAGPAPAEVQQQWAGVLARGDGSMPVFPMPLGDLSQRRPEVVEVHDLLDAAELDAFEARAAAAGVRLISLSVSLLTTVTAEVAASALRAVFPVHSRHDESWHGAVGWFITNAVLECDDPDPAACAAAVKQSLALGSYPLAPIFGPSGMPAGPGMFALSWLDARRLPVQLDDALRVQHVSAVIPTDGVMVWFIVNGSGLHLRVRYPDTPEARASLRRWIEAVDGAFRASAREASLRR